MATSRVDAGGRLDPVPVTDPTDDSSRSAPPAPG